jgi:uncharacterized membrane protein YecN with MAPEG domain
MATDPRREAAIARLKQKRDFKGHVATYIAVNLLLYAIWAISGFGFPWPIFVTIFWGFGVIMHAWSIWGEKPITEDDIAREMERGGGDVVE